MKTMTYSTGLLAVLLMLSQAAAAVAASSKSADAVSQQPERDPTLGPHLMLSWRLLDAKGRPATKLQAGQTYELHLVVSPKDDQQVKLNGLVTSHQVQLANSHQRGLIKSPRRGAAVEAKTGKAVLPIKVSDQAADPPSEIRLEANVVVCDQGEQWCAAAREQATLNLAAGHGRMAMQLANLGFHAGDKARVVLKAGDSAPDFEVTDADNQKRRLSDYRNRKNVILVFSRAHW